MNLDNSYAKIQGYESYRMIIYSDKLRVSLSVSKNYHPTAVITDVKGSS